MPTKPLALDLFPKKIKPMFYRMPGEWESHRSTWLTWPQNKTTWPGRMLKEVESIYLQMIEALLPHEVVNLLVPDKKTAALISKKINPKKYPSSNLIFHEVKTVDTWIRDYGPIFVKSRDGSKAFTKWIFNAWGGKYQDLARDNQVVNRTPSLKNFKRFDIDIVLEGGSIDMNGQGICLTTEQCLLNPNRNPKRSRQDLENILSRYLGVTQVIWLKEGIEGDDTDGHVDDISRFVNPTTIVTAMESDSRDKNHEILNENFKILKNVKNEQGKKFKIITLPMPGKVGVGRGDDSTNRLPASYANFYIANQVVLVPIYSHANDKKALTILRSAFPGRRVVGIECTALVYGLGSIHCVTQQEPV